MGLDQEQFIQRTAPLRTYLVEQAEATEELLDRFKVRDLLEEAQTKLKDFKRYQLTSVRPLLYAAIVTNPTVEIFESQVLNDLVNPENFRKYIPCLFGYGLALTHFSHVMMLSEKRWTVEVARGREPGLSASAKSTYGEERGYYEDWCCNVPVPVRISNALQVSVEGTSQGGSVYDLTYSHQLRREATKEGAPGFIKKLAFLTPKQGISFDGQVEALQKLIDNDVLGELSGKYSDILYRFGIKEHPFLYPHIGPEFELELEIENDEFKKRSPNNGSWIWRTGYYKI